MKKSILSSLLLVSSFLLFQSGASASEQDVPSNQPLESADDIIHFDISKQDILITDDFIIEAITEDELNSLKKNQSYFNKRKEGLNLVKDGELGILNGVWDLLGTETVYSRSSVWASNGGDYQVVIAQEEKGPIFYRLKEEDEGGRSQNVSDLFTLSGDTGGAVMTWRDISRWCDGDDGLAEFFMTKQTHTSTGIWMAFYD